MTLRRRLLDRLRDRRAPGAGGTGAQPDVPGVPTGPVRPNRMVVSGRSPIMDWYRPFEQAHRVDPRMRLWRDTAAVLAIFAIAIVAWDWLPKPSQGVLSETGAPTHSASPTATVPGSPEESLAASLEPTSSVGPSQAGPTPGPTPRSTPRVTPAPPRPTPRPSVAPTATPPPPTPVVTPSPSPEPSPSPSVEPSPSPSPEPSPSPSPEPSPSPSVEPSAAPSP